MFVSGPSLFVAFSIAVLFLAKQLASRSFYKEIQQPYRSFGWRNDPTRQDPRVQREADLHLWTQKGEGEEAAETQQIS